MAKRSKRLERGIESITEQIRFHEEKKHKAEEEGNIELVDYYGREILGLTKAKNRKERQLEKEGD